MEGITFICIIVILLCAVIFYVCVKGDNFKGSNISSIQQFADNSWNDFLKYCNNVGIDVFDTEHSRYIFEHPHYEVSWGNNVSFKKCSMWQEQDKILFASPITFMPKHSAVLLRFDNIEFFTKDGSVSYTNKVISKGSDVSITGAVIGGAIAGTAGAILGGSKGPKLENVTELHDTVLTYIYYRENGEVKTATVKGQGFYEFIMQKFPKKEYSYVLAEQQKQPMIETNSVNSIEDKGDIKTRLKQLWELRESGIITEYEYRSKRKELIDLL